MSTVCAPREILFCHLSRSAVSSVEFTSPAVTISRDAARRSPISRESRVTSPARVFAPNVLSFIRVVQTLLTTTAAATASTIATSLWLGPDDAAGFENTPAIARWTADFAVNVWHPSPNGKCTHPTNTRSRPTANDFCARSAASGSMCLKTI